MHLITMNKHRIWPALCCAFAVFGLGAEETETPAPEMRIAVLDFTCTDLAGQKLRLTQDKPLNTGYKGILNQEDRQSIDDRMQGFVRMIDGRFAGTAALIGIEQTRMDNKRARAERHALADKILKGKQRPVVIGAEYMTAYLGEYPKAFSPANKDSVENALKQLDFGRIQTNADADARIAEFSQKSGATHALIGTVSDFKTEIKKFSGYGVKSERIKYELDVIVKLIDLKNNRIAFSGVFTGERSQTKTKYAETVNDALFQDLMKDALKQAAAAMNERFAPAEKKQ